MNEEVLHKGIIERIEAEHITVRIQQTSACLHCKIAGHCNSAESKEKVIDIWTRNARNYRVGQEVDVVMSGRLGLKAVLLAFVVPVVLAFTAIILVLWLTGSDGMFPVAEPYNQGLGALTGICCFVAYYIILYFFRDSLKRQFQFRLKG